MTKQIKKPHSNRALKKGWHSPQHKLVITPPLSDIEVISVEIKADIKHAMDRGRKLTHSTK